MNDAQANPMTTMIVALLMDRPGALNRVVSLVRRRGLNLESLHVVRTESAGVHRLTMVVETDRIQLLHAQLERLIDVLDVRVLAPGAEPARAAENALLITLAQADGVVG